MAGGRPTVDPKLANVIAAVITAVWAISFLADIPLEGYEPSPFLHFLMLAVAGAIFGFGNTFGKGGKGGDT